MRVRLPISRISFYLLWMQHIAAARIVCGLKKYDHITRSHSRDSLHWLRVPQRLTFKLCLLAYKSLHGCATDYLTELCIPVARSEPRRRLRSSAVGDYITLHCITSFLTPITSTVTNGASTKSFKFSECELKKASFQKKLKVYQCLWVPGDWTEENSMPSVRRTRNSVRRTLVSTVEVHIGSCWRISVSHDHARQVSDGCHPIMAISSSHEQQ